MGVSLEQAPKLVTCCFRNTTFVQSLSRTLTNSPVLSCNYGGILINFLVEVMYGWKYDYAQHVQNFATKIQCAYL